MSQIFSKSNKFKQEYCCTIVRLGEILPIEGKDVIGQTIVDNYTMIVNKRECHEGDIMFYAANESELNAEFLSKNSLYEIGEYMRNANCEEVRKLKAEGKDDEAKRMVGFFNKYGRVKTLRLGGVSSYGFLFTQETAARWKPELANINLEDYIGEEFDTICDELFIKGYVPRFQNNGGRRGNGRAKRRLKNEAKIERIEAGQFAYHYDTAPVQRNMNVFKPEDIVDISIKCDGTSFIMGNLKVRQPQVWQTGIQWIDDLLIRLYLKLPEKWQKWDEHYEDVYSSRNKIRSGNEFFTAKNNFKRELPQNKEDYPVGLDIMYPYYGELLKGKIPSGYTIYGEIVGYITGTNTGIITRGGKVYDYGCEVGKNKLMLYRVTSKHMDGSTYEFNVQDVVGFSRMLVKQYPELKDYIMELPIVYHGTLRDLYPELDIENHWHENLFAAMKNDTVHFGMEQKEPLCKNSVWREGVVIRIEDDILNEAFKLKAEKYLHQEADDISKGIVTGDLLEGYGEGEDAEA